MEVVTEKQVQTSQLSKDWQSDFDYDTRYNYKFLKFLGLWPAETHNEKVLRKFYVAFVLAFLAILIIPHGTYVLLIEPSIEIRLRMMGPFSLLNSGKYIYALLNRANFASCLKHMAEDWKTSRSPDERLVMIQAGQWTETFTKICLTFMYSSTLSYSFLMPLIQQVSAVLNPNVTRRLMYPVSFGTYTVTVATDQEFLFDLLVLVLTFSIFIMSTISIGMTTLLAKFAMHAYGQIRILKKYLILIDGREGTKDISGSSQSNFKIVAIRHLRILRFISTVDDSLSGICLLELCSCTFSICVLGHYILKEFERKNIMFVVIYSCRLISYISNIFILCFIGERLSKQCREIGIWTYEVDWSKFLAKKENVVGLQLIILVTQNPPKLTAGKFFFLSMESFSTAMKASATYLNMLLKFA